MIYEFIGEHLEGKKKIRTYRNNQGNETQTTWIFQDASGKDWYGFVDLLKIPYIRMAYAQNITNLFTVGLSLNDVLKWCQEEREILRSGDADKIEKAIALTYEKERHCKQVADPVQQHLSLATVYVLEENERVDSFSESKSVEKLVLWKADPGAISFFLNWLTGHTQNYIQRLEKISRIALPQLNPRLPITGKD